MKWKLYLIVAVALAAWVAFTKYLYDGKVAAENKIVEQSAENLRLSGELATSIKEAKLKAEAFAAREQSLIQDRKEIEDEYKKLLELKSSDERYSSWSDDRLPDCVSKLLQ